MTLYLNPADYGVDFTGDASKADANTAAMNSCVADAVAGSYSVELPGGRCHLSGPVNVLGSVKITGRGPFATWLVPTGASAIRVSTEKAVTIRDLGIVNTTQTESVDGIVLTDTETENAGSVLDNLLLKDLARGVASLRAKYTLFNALQVQAVRGVGAVGLYIDNLFAADHGDSTIVGCHINGSPDFATNRAVGILHLASGGLKIVGTKVLGWDYGYRMAMPDRAGMAGMTDLLVSACSFEMIDHVGIAFGREPGSKATFSSVTVTGCQFADGSPNAVAIKLLGADKNWLRKAGGGGNVTSRMGGANSVQVPGWTSFGNY